MAATERERLVAVGGLADDGQAGGLERLTQQAAHEARVVGDDDPRRG